MLHLPGAWGDASFRLQALRPISPEPPRCLAARNAAAQMRRRPHREGIAGRRAQGLASRKNDR
jgi:hypothetical protein